jgi:PAS domain S-box-containing protein
MVTAAPPQQPYKSDEQSILYRTLASNFPNGAVLLFDHDLRYTLAEGAGLAEVGLSKELLEGKTIWELFSPEVCDLLEPNYRAVLAGTPSIVEVPFADRIYLLHVVPVRDERGAVFAGMVMTQDITAKKQAEAALQASNEALQAMIQASPLGILVLDREKKVTLWNPACERMFGWSEQEVLGRPLPIVPPDRQEEAHALFHRVMHGEYLTGIELHRQRKDSSLMDVSLSTAPLRDAGGQIVGSMAMYADITAKKRAEEELKRSEAALAEAQAVAHLGSSEWDVATNTVTWSDEMYRLFGRAPQSAGPGSENYVGFIHPDDRTRVVQTVEQCYRSHEPCEFDYRALWPDGSIRWLHAHGRAVLNEQGEVVRIVGTAQDITERIEAQQLLEQRVADRTKELSTLLQVSRNVTSTLKLEPLLGQILNQLKTAVDYSAASIGTLQDSIYQTIIYRGSVPEEEVQWMPSPMDSLDDLRMSVIDAQVIQDRQPLIIPDIQGDTHLARLVWQYLQSLDEPIKSQFQHVHSWMRVPLIVKDTAVGILDLYHHERNYYSAAHAELALAWANQAAVAIENARLFEAEQRRAEQFQVISEMGRRITSILSVDELLVQTARLIRETFGHYHVHIGLIEDDVVVYKTLKASDDPSHARCEATRPRVGQEGFTGRVAATGEALLVPDSHNDPRAIPLTDDPTRSELVVPLKVKGQVIGVLDVESDRVNAFDESDLAVLQLLADQVAIAIENARLYEQAQQLAAVEERQKLARELHDSVSQALYGIGLGARTARTLLDREPKLVAEPLDYVLSLAEAGLAEMRALIFELRPESLETEGLVAALTKQAASLRARHNVEVETMFCDEPEAALDVKQVLYRIAQEALHNTVKHARASRVEMRLVRPGDALFLEIKDDGVGFDARGDFPGHLGLRSMCERAERLGGAFEVESAPGEGTRIRVHLPI